MRTLPLLVALLLGLAIAALARYATIPTVEGRLLLGLLLGGALGCVLALGLRRGAGR